MIDWDDYRVFLQVLRRRGYASAASELGVAPATARAAIDRLADRLGAALFLHAPEGLAPTIAALELEPVAQAMADSMSALSRMASGPLDTVEGRVAVGAHRGEMLAQAVLVPVLAYLVRIHPRLNVDLALDVGVDRLRAGAIDISLAVGDFDHAGLDARRGARVRFGLFAHREYLARAGTPSSAADLGGFAIIRPDNFEALRPFHEAAGLLAHSGGQSLVCESRAAQLMAIRLGLGIGSAPKYVAANDPNLVAVLPNLGVELTVWLAIRQDDVDVARIVTVRDAFLALMARKDSLSQAPLGDLFDTDPLAVT